MAAHSPQPTDHDPKAGCTLSRRDFAKTVGMAAAIGAGATASSTPASAAVDGLIFNPTTPTGASLWFATEVGGTLADRITGSSDLETDKIALHKQARTAGAWWDDVAVRVENELTNLKMVAHIEARDTIADSWENGDDATTARQNAQDAIYETYANAEKNMLESAATNWAQLGSILEVVRGVDSITDEFIAWTPLNDNYTGSGQIDGPNTYIMEDFVEGAVTLVDGTSYYFEGPKFHAEWDNGDTSTEEMHTLLIDRWDSTNEHFVVPTDNGNEYTDDINAQLTAVSVSDGDDLHSHTVGYLDQVAKFRDQITEQADAAVNNYDATFVEELYTALENGTINADDIRGVSAMAEHLSGTTDATSQRYQMALLATLGVSRADLSNVSSMTMTFDGWTKANYESEDDRLQMYLDGYESDLQIEGQMFGELGTNTSLQTGMDYLVGPEVFVKGQTGDGTDFLALFDKTTGRVSWLRIYADEPNGVDWSDDGQTMIVYLQNGMLYAYDGGTMNERFSMDLSNGGYGRDAVVSADGSTIVAVEDSDGAIVIDVESQSRSWTYTGAGDPRNVSLRKGGRDLLLGDRTNNTLICVDLENQTEAWTATDFDGYVEQTAYAPDQDTFLVGVGETGISYRNAADGTEIAFSSDWTNGYVAGVDIDPTGQYGMAVDMAGATMKVFNLSDMSTAWTYTATGANLKPGKFTPDGEHVITSDTDQNNTVLLNVEDGSVAETFSPDVFGSDHLPTRFWTWPPNYVSVGGKIARANATDAPSGTGYQLHRGILTLSEMKDSDGNDVTPFEGTKEETIAEIEDETGRSIDDILSDVDGISSTDEIKDYGDLVTVLEATSVDDPESLTTVEVVKWKEPEHDEVNMTEYRDYLDNVTTEYKNSLQDDENGTSGDDGGSVGFPAFGDIFGGSSWLGLAIIGGVVMLVIGFVTDLVPGMGD